MWLFVLTIVFGLLYLVAYPGLGSYEGELRLDHSAASTTPRWSKANKELAPLYAQFTARKAEELAGDASAMAIGERLFMNNCAQCHGSDARGSKGFPNLADSDWLLRRHAREDRRNHHRGPPRADAADGGGGRQRRRREERRQLCAEPVEQPARLAARAARQEQVHGLRRLPRHRRQGQPGAGRAQPDRRHLAARLGRAGHHRHRSTAARPATCRRRPAS